MLYLLYILAIVTMGAETNAPAETVTQDATQARRPHGAKRGPQKHRRYLPPPDD